MKKLFIILLILSFSTGVFASTFDGTYSDGYDSDVDDDFTEDMWDDTMGDIKDRLAIMVAGAIAGFKTNTSSITIGNATYTLIEIEEDLVVNDDVTVTGTATFGGIIYANRSPTSLDTQYSATIGVHLNVGNNITVGGTVDGIDIATDVTANTTHRSSNDGSDHSFIDQSVVIVSSPTFAGATVSTFTFTKKFGDGTNYIMEISTDGIGASNSDTALSTEQAIREMITYYETHPSTGVSVVELVRNNSGATIPKGSAVYFSGVVGLTPTIGLANSTDTLKAECKGLTTSAISNNSNGLIIIIGELDDVDTSAFSANDALYLGIIDGSKTNTVPVSGRIQHLGSVGRSHASQGDILVNIESDEPKKGVAYNDDMVRRLGNTDGSTYFLWEDFISVVVATMTDNGHLYLPDLSVETSISVPTDSLDPTDIGAGIMGNDVIVSSINAGVVHKLQLAADCVDETKLEDNSLDSEHYNDGSIDAIHLAAGITTSGDYGFFGADIPANAYVTTNICMWTSPNYPISITTMTFTYPYGATDPVQITATSNDMSDFIIPGKSNLQLDILNVTTVDGYDLLLSTSIYASFATIMTSTTTLQMTGATGGGDPIQVIIEWTKD